MSHDAHQPAAFPAQASAPGTPYTAFDRLVLLVIGLLLGALLLTVLLGDRVGVTLERAAPLGTARSTSRIIMQFSETMNRDTVAERLRVLQVKPEAASAGGELPPEAIIGSLAGTITWSGATLAFYPAEVLQPGATYLVTLMPGATSDTGREVLAEYRFSFSVSRPRVAFLAPASGVPLNIWLADPADPASARQVTFSPSGIFDFGVSPDGSQIAFSERNSSTGTSDIKLLNLETGGLQQLTNCLDADCTTPVWRPDGQVIAYERVDFNSGLENIAASPTRIWLIDLSTTPATTRPLFSDSQILGYGLQWSRDGSRATLFDVASQGILLHDFTTDSTAVIPSRYGSTGALSPDGTLVVFPEVTLTSGEARSYLQLANTETQEIVPLSYPDEAVDDDAAAWSPDGTKLVISRRYTDERFTRGRQLYLFDLADKTVEPLVVDPLYANGIFSFDPTGTQLVIQRFPELTASGELNNAGRPEIWTFDLAARALSQVAVDSFYPRWVP